MCVFVSYVAVAHVYSEHHLSVMTCCGKTTTLSENATQSRPSCRPVSRSVSWQFSFYNPSRPTESLFLGLVIIVSICCVPLFCTWWHNHENTVSRFSNQSNMDHIPTEERNFPPHSFISGIPSQISMLSCSTSSISVATRHTTSSPLLLRPPNPIHYQSLCQNKMNASPSLTAEPLSLIPSTVLLSPFLPVFKGVQD